MPNAHQRSRRSSSIPLRFRVQAAAASLKRALKTLHLVGTPCVASLSQGEATSLSLGLGVTPLQRSILRALGKSRYALLNGRGAARPYRAFRISLLPNMGALASFVLAPWRGNCFEPAYLYFVGWKTWCRFCFQLTCQLPAPRHAPKARRRMIPSRTRLQLEGIW